MAEYQFHVLVLSQSLPSLLRCKMQIFGKNMTQKAPWAAEALLAYEILTLLITGILFLASP